MRRTIPNSSFSILVAPIAFTLFGREVHWYGLLIAAAILLALPWTLRRAEVRGVDAAQTERSFWWMVAGGIVGARLLYVVQNVPYYTTHARELWAIWEGGLAIHGAILGGAVALAVSVGFHRTTFWKLADAAVPALLLGMILGRFGNWANNELYGPPTNLPWKLFIPPEARPPDLVSVAYYHPTFLYDALLNSLLLFVLLASDHRAEPKPKNPASATSSGQGSFAGLRMTRPLKPGELALGFFLGISLNRFISEFWRLGNHVAGDLSPAQLVSLLIAAVAVTLLGRLRSGRLRLG